VLDKRGTTDWRKGVGVGEVNPLVAGGEGVGVGGWGEGTGRGGVWDTEGTTP
jgi:hypothetical protein